MIAGNLATTSVKLDLSVRAFIADIAAPSTTMDTPAYQYFTRLGFRRPYARTHHARL